MVISPKDRLLRLGAEQVFALCKTHDCEVVAFNQGENWTPTSFVEEKAGHPLLLLINLCVFFFFSGRTK